DCVGTPLPSLPSAYLLLPPRSPLHPPAPPPLYALSLHDALPISRPADANSAWEWCIPSAPAVRPGLRVTCAPVPRCRAGAGPGPDRKSTRLNSSHVSISYAVFCLKKKNIREQGRRHVVRAVP